MSPAVALDIPSVPLVAPLSWGGSTLSEVALDLLHKADPYGKFCCRSPRQNDYTIHLGRTSSTDFVVHGSGWNFYCGPSPSPLADDQTVNPIGPALAAILAASEAFRTDLAGPPEKNPSQCSKLAICRARTGFCTAITPAAHAWNTVGSGYRLGRHGDPVFSEPCHAKLLRCPVRHGRSENPQS